MTEDPNDDATPPLRALSIDELSSYLNAKGAIRPCEACGSEEWAFQQPNGYLSGQIGLVVQDGGDRPPGAVMPIYVMACLNCGGARSFLAHYVLKWLKANPT